MAFSALDAIEIHDLISSSGLVVWIDGSWAVNALLKSKKYECNDLDLVMKLEERDEVSNILITHGFRVSANYDPESKRGFKHDSRELNIEIHLVKFDKNGNAIRTFKDRPKKEYNRYDKSFFSGTGVINATEVSCLSAYALLEQYKKASRNQRDYSIINDLNKLL